MILVFLKDHFSKKVKNERTASQKDQNTSNYQDDRSDLKV